MVVTSSPSNFEDDVAGLDAGLGGRAVRRDAGHERAGVLRHAERFLPSPRVTDWIFTPSQPRRTSPILLAAAARPVATVSAGTAKPMPIEPPVGEMIAVFTPTTSPSMLNSGPPELPLLIAASVCR